MPSTTLFWMSLRSGRAPNTGSRPPSASDSMAPGVTFMVMRSRSRRSRTSSSWMSTIFSMSSRPSELNVTMSSMRFRNSGLNEACRALSTASFMAALSPVFAASRMYWEPTLLVMMMMAFLKLTTRPWPSVSLPSSSTCSSTLKTSGCAFSSSSSSTTAYG